MYHSHDLCTETMIIVTNSKLRGDVVWSIKDRKWIYSFDDFEVGGLFTTGINDAPS